MCGIIGVIANDNVADRVVDGLKRLEYRGYDSAGIATQHQQALQCVRKEGKLSALEEALKQTPMEGCIGIGHTRWATHGAATENNAHPHVKGNVAVIHNGIIENYIALRKEMAQKGYKFQTDTDTEVIPVLIYDFLQQGHTPHQAVSATLKKLEGAFALGVIFAEESDLLIAARHGSPLAIGLGKEENYIASDAYALAPYTQSICYLKDGDWAELSKSGVTIYNADDQQVEREVKPTQLTGAAVGKGNYEHFMLKEIYEQPSVIGQTLRGLFNPATHEMNLPELSFDLSDITHVTIVACGTSYYAGLVAKYWLEHTARIPTEVDVASEFRYRKPPQSEGGIAVFISQSGETADTLAALRYCKEQGQKIVSIVNARESSIERESDVVMHTLAGPEIGVASTKAFTTQLVTLACFVLALAEAKQAISEQDKLQYLHSLAEVPALAVEVLNYDDDIRELARDVAKARDVLFIGRGSSFAIAMEGALKLKEISYIHAEGLAAGELKHGPIALVDENVPVIVIAPYDELFDKTASNVQEVAARGGKVVFFSDKEGAAHLDSVSIGAVEMPKADIFVTPILYAIPVQLLAYHAAVIKGTDIDQPRNLAKSVTVE